MDAVLGTGVTLAFFQSAGICPLEILSLNSLVMLGAIAVAMVLRRPVIIPSTPVALK